MKNYTSLDKYDGTPLLGAYEIDAEGVIPEKEMTLVDKGILRQMDQLLNRLQLVRR